MSRNENEDQTAEDQVEGSEETVEEVKVDEVKVAFDASVEAGKEEDAIKLDMITAGATFKNVTRLFNQYMVDSGLAVSKEDKATAVATACEGKDLSTEAGFEEASKAIIEAIEGTTERSADAQVRAYCKKNELEVFAKPKPAAGAGATGFTSQFHDFLVGNPTMTVEEATAFIMGAGENKETSANVKNHLTMYLSHYRLANRIAIAK